MDFMGMIAKINPFFIIFTEICPYFEAEKVPLFRKNLVRACAPLGHQSPAIFPPNMVESKNQWYHQKQLSNECSCQ
jgi:hypothetical protein